MTEQKVKTKKATISCTVNWQYIEESSPAFSQMMALVLQPRKKQREPICGEKDAKRNEQL
ncbi:hypothetical protein ACFLYX_02215 [Chloroflexota bacterium]